MPDDPTLAFEALADPTRREILRVLSEGELAATDIANSITWVGRTAVSSHLRILKTAGLITERRDGKYRYYSSNPGPATGVIDFLSAVYRSALDDLESQREQSVTAPSTEQIVDAG